MQLTTTGQRANTGRLVKGWQPETAADAQLLSGSESLTGSSLARVLMLAQDAYGALTVCWQASPDHLTLLSPWEVSALACSVCERESV